MVSTIYFYPCPFVFPFFSCRSFASGVYSDAHGGIVMYGGVMGNCSYSSDLYLLQFEVQNDLLIPVWSLIEQSGTGSSPGGMPL